MNDDSRASVPSLGRGVAVLSLVVLVLFAATAVCLVAASETARLPAAVVAAVVCWVGAVGGLMASVAANRVGQPIAGVLAGMLFRVMAPLGVGEAVALGRHPLGPQGLFFFMLGYYLVLLAVETWLSLQYVQEDAQADSQTTDKVA